MKIELLDAEDIEIKNKHTAFTKVVEQAAASLITKDDLIEWFERHKSLS